MAYLKPNFFTLRVFNPLAMRFGISGAVTLAVAGRRSGREQTLPVIPVTVGDERYLVSPRGETDWVRNLRAAGRGALRDGRHSTQFRSSEIPVAERASIIEAYKVAAGQAVRANFAALPRPDDHPVFHITDEPGGTFS